MTTSFTSKITTPQNISQPALWFVFKDEELLLYNSNQIPALIDISVLNLEIASQHYLGIYQDTHCFVAETAMTTSLPKEFAFTQLRKSYDLVNNEELFLIASRAKQILIWDKNTQFCGHCGHKTLMSKVERAKVCPECKTMVFPQISPVALVLVWRDREILLARSPHFQAGIYSVLAGFVEPGETLEQTVHREVKEEVGINIKNLNYFGSQPWPFPSNLMLGFTAEYAGGELMLDPVEIEDAKWFKLDQLPPLPGPISLSRRIIEAFLTSRLGCSGRSPG